MNLPTQYITRMRSKHTRLRVRMCAYTLAFNLFQYNVWCGGRVCIGCMPAQQSQKLVRSFFAFDFCANMRHASLHTAAESHIDAAWTNVWGENCNCFDVIHGMRSFTFILFYLLFPFFALAPCRLCRYRYRSQLRCNCSNTKTSDYNRHERIGRQQSNAQMKILCLRELRCDYCCCYYFTFFCNYFHAY